MGLGDIVSLAMNSKSDELRGRTVLDGSSPEYSTHSAVAHPLASVEHSTALGPPPYPLKKSVFVVE